MGTETVSPHTCTPMTWAQLAPDEARFLTTMRGVAATIAGHARTLPAEDAEPFVTACIKHMAAPLPNASDPEGAERFALEVANYLSSTVQRLLPN